VLTTTADTCAPNCAQVSDPDGSSSNAPVDERPGPGVINPRYHRDISPTSSRSDRADTSARQRITLSSDHRNFDSFARHADDGSLRLDRKNVVRDSDDRVKRAPSRDGRHASSSPPRSSNGSSASATRNDGTRPLGCSAPSTTDHPRRQCKNWLRTGLTGALGESRARK